MAYADVDVTSSATLIIPQNVQRQEIEICNASASTTVYIGQDSSVTVDNGYPLYPNQSRSFAKINSQWLGDIYGITSSGTADVRYWEVVDTR